MKRLLQLGLGGVLLMSSLSLSAADAGEVVGRHIFGVATDYQGDPVMIDGEALVFDAPAAELDLQRGEESWRVSIFDHVIGGIYLTQLDQANAPVDTHAVDLSAAGGLTGPSGAVKTSWGSVLVTETDPVDGQGGDAFTREFAPFFKGKGDMVNPYHHGWPAELVFLAGEEGSKVIRDYAMGRLFPSQILMMPDEKTFYLTSGGPAGQLFMFVAKQPRSLTSGTLYFVGEKGGRIDYQRLAESSALQVRLQLRRIKVGSIFETAELVESGCPEAFQKIRTQHGRECVKLNPRYERVAGLFEPLRFVAYKGLSPALKNISGIRYSPESGALIVDRAEGDSLSLELGHEPELNSKYIIQGM